MYRDILGRIDGIGIFPAISLVLFFVVFAVVVLYAWRMDRAGVRYMAALPLQEADGQAPAFEEERR